MSDVGPTMRSYRVELVGACSHERKCEKVSAANMDAAVAKLIETIPPDERWYWRELSVSRVSP
jgi:hypothetical protein